MNEPKRFLLIVYKQKEEDGTTTDWVKYSDMISAYRGTPEQILNVLTLVRMATECKACDDGRICRTCRERLIEALSSLGKPDDAVPCKECGQAYNEKVSGEYPCKSCGMPTVHDNSNYEPTAGVTDEIQAILSRFGDLYVENHAKLMTKQATIQEVIELDKRSLQQVRDELAIEIMSMAARYMNYNWDAARREIADRVKGTSVPGLNENGSQKSEIAKARDLLDGLKYPMSLVEVSQEELRIIYDAIETVKGGFLQDYRKDAVHLYCVLGSHLHRETLQLEEKR